jgi:4-alpha-glucanotransferase
MNPVHALFGSDLHRYSPYAPSTRLFLNPLYVPLSKRASHEDGPDLVDWPKAGRLKMDALRRAFENLDKKQFARFADQGGGALLCHARFEVLDQKFGAQGLRSWRAWPGEYRDCNSAAVQRLSATDPEVAFQIFLQWRARESLRAAQTRARNAGMRVGLIADLAVGIDPAGSQAWAVPPEMLCGLSIGAPPDIFNPAGQSWGVTGFSPFGLRKTGFAGYVATLRAAMTDCGGIRLDHAMGLKRLWVVPDGASAAAGLYLRYPFKEMLGLLTLESWLNRAVVIAEDLGTVPDGFREELARRRIHGMAVLWFEQNRRGAFTSPARWNRNAAALSSTHDLPTLAGWWSGRDIVWQKKREPKSDLRALRGAREQDRINLWKALRRAHCAKGAKTKHAGKFADAATRFLAKTPCPIVLMPLEDFIGEKEQPNLPGTINEHPNWRRRAKTAHPFRAAAARKRAEILETERQK